MSRKAWSDNFKFAVENRNHSTEKRNTLENEITAQTHIIASQWQAEVKVFEENDNIYSQKESWINVYALNIDS